MNKDNKIYWDLFIKTGDIRYYLMYKDINIEKK